VGGGVDDGEAGGAARGDEYTGANHEELDVFEWSCDGLGSGAKIAASLGTQAAIASGCFTS
jgi:hypothetical protein